MASPLPVPNIRTRSPTNQLYHVNINMRFLTTVLATMALYSTTMATHCWKNGGIDWNASYKSCMGDALGVWIRKDCKVGDLAVLIVTTQLTPETASRLPKLQL
jgi:hypothetical protein